MGHLWQVPAETKDSEVPPSKMACEPLGIHRKSVKIPWKPWKITGNLWKIICKFGKPGKIIGEFQIFEFKTMENHVETIEHLKTYSRTMESPEYISWVVKSRFKGHQVFGHLALQFGPSLSPFAMRGGVPDSKSLKSHKKTNHTGLRHAISALKSVKGVEKGSCLVSKHHEAPTFWRVYDSRCVKVLLRQKKFLTGNKQQFVGCWGAHCKPHRGHTHAFNGDCGCNSE